MRWLLDTNVWIDALNGESMASRARRAASADDWCGFSAMTRLELFSYPALTERDAVILSRCLGEYSEVAIDEEVIERAAAVRRRVRMKAPDAIIAASALIHSATLVTRDVAGFSRVPGLVLRSPADF